MWLPMGSEVRTCMIMNLPRVCDGRAGRRIFETAPEMGLAGADCDGPCRCRCLPTRRGMSEARLVESVAEVAPM